MLRLLGLPPSEGAAGQSRLNGWRAQHRWHPVAPLLPRGVRWHMRPRTTHRSCRCRPFRCSAPPTRAPGRPCGRGRTGDARRGSGEMGGYGILNTFPAVRELARIAEVHTAASCGLRARPVSGAAAHACRHRAHQARVPTTPVTYSRARMRAMPTSATFAVPSLRGQGRRRRP